MTNLVGKRLVIFGCGYVGAALAHAARAAGAGVTALTRNADRAASLRAAGCTVVEADLATTGWHREIAPGPDFVANTVSAAAPTADGYRQSYVDGARSILEWATEGTRPVGTFVYTSSTGVYPQGGGAEVDEEASTAGASVTGRILVEAEEILRSAPRSAVARTFILRLAGIYGPGRHHLLNALRAGTTRFATAPEFHLNLAHRDDIAAAMLACFTAGPEVAGATFNVSDDAPATRGEVLGWLAQRLGLPAPEFDPAAVAGSARKAGEPTPDRRIRSTRIRRALGWAPRHPDFRAGYEAILAGEV